MVRSPLLEPRPIPTALIVDPDPDTRELFAEVLDETVQDIACAADGAEALAMAIARPPDLLITETSLPRVDGFALCRCLRNEPATANTWILVVTADARGETIARARAAGADAVLPKPASPDVVVRSLDAVIARCRESAETARDGRRRSARARTGQIFCPSCSTALRLERTFFGGIKSERERWEYYSCPNQCGKFRYRPRTRQLQRV